MISPNSSAPISRKVETRAAEKGSGSGSAQKGSGSGSVPNVPPGCPLPPLANVQWEANAKGGWEAWHAPEGANAPRKTKTYLGYVGKRQLAKWERLPTDERRATVAAWIEQKRTEKGISA